MTSFKEDLLKVILNLFLLSVHVAANFVTAINCFLSTFKREIEQLSHHVFLFYCVEYLLRM